MATRIIVFLRTNAFHEDASQYSNSFTIDLPHPTAFTPELFKYALKGLHAVYEKGYSYKKADVELSRTTPLPVKQLDIFGEVSLPKHYSQSRLMAVVDSITAFSDAIRFSSRCRGWHENGGSGNICSPNATLPDGTNCCW